MWTLSAAHASARFISQPFTALVAAATRERMRADYRDVLLRSHRTSDLRERAALQASAAQLREALVASGFDGAVIALLVEGDEQVTYDDGDAAPLHCTICFLGPADALTPVAKRRVETVARRIGEDFAPFEAKVVSPAEFGETPVGILEHPALTDVHAQALADRTISTLVDDNDEHPQWLPHVSGLDDRPTVRFDRVAAMIGGSNTVFPLSQTPDSDADADSPSERETTRDPARRP